MHSSWIGYRTLFWLHAGASDWTGTVHAVCRGGAGVGGGDAGAAAGGRGARRGRPQHPPAQCRPLCHPDSAAGI